MLSGCVLWLRADLGITTVDVAALDPNDVSTGNWSASGLSARTATTITDTNDGAPTLHYVTQTTSGMQANHNATLTVELKAGTKTWAWAACSFGVTAYLNLTTGALGTVTGGSAVVTDMGSGWWKIDLSGTTNGVPIAVGTANGDGGVSYQGNGTGTVQMRNFVVTQRNVSAWADQSGSGNHATQGTAARQPLYVPASINGHPALYFSGSSSADILTTGAFARNQPHSALAVVSWDDFPAANEYFLDGLALNTAIMRKVPATNEAGTYAGVVLNGAVTFSGVPFVASAVFDGANSLVAKDGAATSGSAGVANASGVSIGADGGGAYVAPLWGRIAEVILYSRGLSTAERQQVERYLGARYGIAVA